MARLHHAPGQELAKGAKPNNADFELLLLHRRRCCRAMLKVKGHGCVQRSHGQGQAYGAGMWSLHCATAAVMSNRCYGTGAQRSHQLTSCSPATTTATAGLCQLLTKCGTPGTRSRDDGRRRRPPAAARLPVRSNAAAQAAGCCSHYSHATLAAGARACVTGGGATSKRWVEEPWMPCLPLTRRLEDRKLFFNVASMETMSKTRSPQRTGSHIASSMSLDSLLEHM